MIHLVWLGLISVVWLLQSSIGNFDLAGILVLMYLWRQGSSLRLLTVFVAGLVASLLSGYWIGMWSLVYLIWAGALEYIRQRYTINHWVAVVILTSIAATSSAWLNSGNSLLQLIVWNLLMLGYYAVSRNWLERSEMRLHYEQ